MWVRIAHLDRAFVGSAPWKGARCAPYDAHDILEIIDDHKVIKRQFFLKIHKTVIFSDMKIGKFRHPRLDGSLIAMECVNADFALRHGWRVLGHQQ